MKMQWQSLLWLLYLLACSSQSRFLQRMGSYTAQSCCLESSSYNFVQETKSQNSVHRPQLLKRKDSRSRFEPRFLCLPAWRLTVRPNRLTGRRRMCWGWSAMLYAWENKKGVAIHVTSDTEIAILALRLSTKTAGTIKIGFKASHMFHASQIISKNCEDASFSKVSLTKTKRGSWKPGL